MKYLTVLLDTKKQNRSNFTCGVKDLDTYLINYVSQDIKRNLSVCYVNLDNEKNILGYYTLSSSSIDKDTLDSRYSNKIPYETIPVTLLGRLAISTTCQGKGIGKLLLIDALKRVYELSKSIASYAVIVDPINNEAKEFYEKYGFIELDSGRMFFPVKSIKKLFET